MLQKHQHLKNIKASVRAVDVVKRTSSQYIRRLPDKTSPHSTFSFQEKGPKFSPDEKHV